MSLQPGTRLGNYEVLSDLGRGGMGEVYKARDLKLSREVAIKVLPHEMAADAQRLRRFEQEARAASALNHPNIVTIYEIGEHEGTPYIAMEFVDGTSLREMLADGPLPNDKLIRYATQMAEGLAKAHKVGIVHRDLKPENLMVTSDGYVKILDFGLAKLLPQSVVDTEGDTITKEGTVAGAVMGTASYMSPEQALGKPLDARTDVFSFGAVLYEMATGRKPFQGETPAGLFDEILHKTPIPPSSLNSELSEDFDRLIVKALAKEADQRCPSAKELLTDLIEIDTEPSSVESQTRKSIVVLPFENMSPDPEQEYFCDGMTEEIIADLSKIQSLRVVSRTSSMQLKGTDKNIATIGKELNVRFALEGSVRKAGSNIRITAQLIDSTTDAHLWADKYSGTLEDVFDFQEEVSRSIAEALQLKLSLKDEQILRKRTTDNPKAYEAYLKGRYFWNRRTPEGLRTALQFFREAVDIDPTFAAAYSGLADAYNFLGLFLVIPPNEAYPLAKVAAERALDLDDTLAEAHISLAVASFIFDWNWDVVEQEFTKAIELNPNDGSTHHFYGSWFACSMGRHEEALAEMQLAYKLDPLIPVHSADTACVILFARRYDDAIQQCLRTIDYFPEFPVTYYYLTIAYVLEGRYEEAIEISKKAANLTSDHPMYLSIMGYALAAAGRTEEARSVLEKLNENKQDFQVAPYGIALIQTAMDENEAAVEWLERAQQEHAWQVSYMRVDPCLDPLRSDPRFQDLLRRMNFPE